MDFEAVCSTVKALKLPGEDFALFGSAPLLARGLVDEINDVDIVARKRAWQKAVQLGTVEGGSRGDRVVRLGEVEIFDGWYGLFDIPTLIETAETFEGIPFVKLEHVLTFKKHLNRPKDQAHIERLKTYLAR